MTLFSYIYSSSSFYVGPNSLWYKNKKKVSEPTIMEATTGPLITHQRAVCSFVSQHLEEEEEEEQHFD